MPASALVIVALLVGAVAIGVERPKGWSDEVRAGTVIELVVLSAVVLLVSLLYRLSPKDGRGKTLIRSGRLIVLLLAIAAAVVLAVLLPFDLPRWSRWVLVGFAALIGLMIVVPLVVSRLPPTIRRQARTGRGLGALSLVLLATAAVVFAAIYPELPGWVRWLLAGFAVLLVVIARLWRQAAWPDVAATSLVAVAIAAGIAAAVTEEPVGDEPTVTFKVPFDTLTVLDPVENDGKAILLVVKPTKLADDAPISYESTRYAATVSPGVAVGEQAADVGVTLERGPKDSSASAFSADLNRATRIYVMSGG